MKKINWHIYTRGTIHLQRVYIIVTRFIKYSTKLIGEKFDTVLYYNKGGKLWWGWDPEQLNNVGKRILKETENKKGRKKHMDKLNDYMLKGIDVAEKIKKIDLKNLTDKELIEKYNWLCDAVEKPHAISMALVDAVDEYPFKFLNERIKKKVNVPESEFNKIYNDLTAPIYSTYFNDQELMLLKLALEIKNTKKDYKKDLKRIHEKYWWVTLGWENLKIKSLKDFEKDLQTFLKLDAEEEIKKRESLLVLRKKKRDELIKKYNIGKEIINLIELFDDYTYSHDLRKEMQMRILNSFYLILNEISKRKDVPIEDLDWFSVEDVNELMQTGKYDKKEIDKRKKSTLAITSEKGFEIFSGQEAITRGDEEIKKDIKELDEIKGQGVSQGKVQGRVKVVAGIQEALRRIEKGDILVCGMTLPDYVPAMKKAIAIVTDEGGITCHAAIFSRELGIPCIVGTKIATQVLKDGDYIEVDANRGIVRKVVK